MKFHHILAAGLAATALLGAPAQAMSKRTEVSIAVDFNDLDLRDPSQVAELRERVDAAAEAACTHPDALSVNVVLTSLDLSYNSLGDAVKQLLRDAVKGREGFELEGCEESDD